MVQPFRVDRVGCAHQVSQEGLDGFKTGAASGELSEEPEDGGQPVQQVRVEDVLHQEKCGPQRHGAADLLVAIRREIAEVVLKVGDVAKQLGGRRDEIAKPGGNLPAAFPVVEHQREDRGKEPLGLAPPILLPDAHGVTQELEPDVGVGVALVLEEEIEKGGPTILEAHREQEVRVVGAKFGVDKRILGGIERIEIEERDDFGWEVVLNKVPGRPGAGQDVFDEVVVGLGEVRHEAQCSGGRRERQKEAVSPHWPKQKGSGPSSAIGALVDDDRQMALDQAPLPPRKQVSPASVKAVGAYPEEIFSGWEAVGQKLGEHESGHCSKLARLTSPTFKNVPF
jgi:hypothetical protein